MEQFPTSNDTLEEPNQQVTVTQNIEIPAGSIPIPKGLQKTKSDSLRTKLLELKHVFDTVHMPMLPETPQMASRLTTLSIIFVIVVFGLLIMAPLTGSLLGFLTLVWEALVFALFAYIAYWAAAWLISRYQERNNPQQPLT